MSQIVIKKSSELIDPQAQLIVNFLKEMGLPYDNIIADQTQRAIIGDNIQGLVAALPAEVKKDARYLSRFVIGAGIGLFDYSLNAVWNEVVLNLRKKAVMYGLDIFFDGAVGGSKAREYYSTEEDLSSLKDSVLLDTSRKLELISDTTYKKLKHILEMRNDTGISHPNSYSINAYELLGYLQNCIQDVLNDNPTEAALQVQAFIKNLKTTTGALDNATAQGIEKRIAELPSHLCGSLLRTVFGIYVSADTDPVVRKNISLIAPGIWKACQDEAKYKLGIVLEGYNVNLYKDKHALGQQFFDVVGGNAFRSPSERVIIVDELITELLDKHNGWDNFHHEAPVAAQLYSYVPDQAAIFDNLCMRLFKVILMCRIGRGVAYLEGVSPGGRRYYDAILAIAGDKFAPYVMASLGHYEITAKLGNQLCRKHAKAALQIVRKTVINARLIECLDYLIANIEGTASCVNNAEFRKLSQGYINWP
ncbi:MULTISPECIES: hypothetical protein [unclassified Mesorhizobium]|uniref:hypothetical protein n=1 Tax=unclassified Mesorhizobium TaxID=325217 RepID=UPI0003D04E1F|nr:hypothetical protein [Mesorhizobium sp. L2C066B000]ESZ31561.1 hypothetical protein X732_29605 [Mesorhizobium sp. L2C066B000]